MRSSWLLLSSIPVERTNHRSKSSPSIPAHLSLSLSLFYWRTNENRTKQYQALIPNIIETRAAANKHVLAVDFTKFPTSLLRDCIHPTDLGYRVMGDWWYDFITQIPSGWLAPPIGPDPFRNSSNSTADANR